MRVFVFYGFPLYHYPHAYCYFYRGHYYHYPYDYEPTRYTHIADNPTLYQLGFDWGKAVRYQTKRWTEFVDYLAAYIVPAPDEAIEEFRSGFLYGYGDEIEADKVFNQGLDQATAQVSRTSASKLGY